MLSPTCQTEQLDRYLTGTLDHARRLDYAGHSKHDALNSSLVSALTCGRRIARLCLIQGVMRFPVDLRRVLGVRRERNAKGISLFARALMDRGTALGVDGDLSEARELLDWLVEHSADYPVGRSWGYPYPWQDVGFFAPRSAPNRVVTSFVAQALLEGYKVFSDPRYLDAAGEAVRFLLDAPGRILETPHQLCLAYVPSDDVKWVVMDVSILTAAVVARHAALSGDHGRVSEARRLVAYVIDKQTSYHAWYYAHPPRDARITHDNYHTGFILDALHDYMRCTGEFRWADAYRRGLAFYRERLFDADGAPRWMHDKAFPRDVHGSAQGILTFLRAANDSELGCESYREDAHRAARWAIKNLWMPDRERFAWQRTRHRLRKHDLLRWCQGWMARALAALLRFEITRQSRQRVEELEAAPR